jgi:hypothetical protein
MHKSQPPIDDRRRDPPRNKIAGLVDLRMVCSMLLIAIIVNGCATSRASFTAGQQAIAAVFDIPHARAWANDDNGFESAEFRPVAEPHQPIRILALVKRLKQTRNPRVVSVDVLISALRGRRS